MALRVLRALRERRVKWNYAPSTDGPGWPLPMLTAFAAKADRTVPTDDPGSAIWIDLYNPTEPERLPPLPRPGCACPVR